MSLEARLIYHLGSFRLDLSLHLREGITVLFGPSGAGKSLTLQLLGGLRKLQKGYVRRGETLLAGGLGVHIPPEKRNMGMVFQDLALFPHLTVEENILFGVTCRNKREKAREWVPRMELEGLEQRYPHQLSGGQRQRVALARALAPEPSVLLMDEPFSALDGPLKSRLRREVKRLQRETGIPILYVTHSVEDIGALADQVLFVREGRDVAFLEASRLWNGHASAEIWNALGWGTVLEGRVEHLEGGTWFAWGDQRLLLPSQISSPGEARIFLPPHKIHLLDPHRPVEPELRGGILRGVLGEMAYLRGRCTLHVQVGGAVVDVDVPEEHSSRLAPKEGMPVLLGIRPEAVVVMPRRRGLQKSISGNVNSVKGVAGEMKDSLVCARDRMKEKLGERKDIEGNEAIVAEPLGVEDAIGDPSPYKDFPLLIGEEKLMEVRFRNGRGQAFTSCPARWQGTLEQVLNLPLEEERDRGLLIATLNALAADFGFADKTVHCKDGSPDLCGRTIAEHLVETFGRDHVVGIVGYQPAFVKRVAEAFGPERVRVTDLNPKNVGFQRFGVEIWHGERDLERLARESTLALVTGSALSNGSFDAVWDTLKEHQVQAFCFGTTIAGIAALLDYPRLCFEAC